MGNRKRKSPGVSDMFPLVPRSPGGPTPTPTPTPSDVWGHFSCMLVPSNCQAVTEDMESVFQGQLDVEAGIGDSRLLILGGYTQLRDGHMIVTWNVSTADWKGYFPLSEACRLKRRLENLFGARNVVESSARIYGATRMFQLVYTVAPERR